MRRGWRRSRLLTEKVRRRRTHRRPPAETDILLRLVNLLGLLLLVMTVAILSNHENIKEILELAKHLFWIVP